MLTVCEQDEQVRKPKLVDLLPIESIDQNVSLNVSWI
jgi:hypothetical protein